MIAAPLCWPLFKDGQIALLGSANLTMAGTLQSDEMNVEIRQPAFVTNMYGGLKIIMATAHSPEAVLNRESP